MLQSEIGSSERGGNYQALWEKNLTCILYQKTYQHGGPYSPNETQTSMSPSSGSTHILNSTSAE